MKKETKTIIGGISLTVLVLAGVLFTLYKTMGNKAYNENNTNNNQNTNSKNEKPNIDNNPPTNNTYTSENNTNQDKTINNSKDEVVTVYIFRGEGCPHCEHAIEYFNNYKGKNIKVKAYETWKNTNNSKLMDLVASKLNADVTGVPFIVIGDEYHVGFGNGDEIASIAEKKLKNKDYKNAVETVLDENKDLDVKVENIK